MRDSRNTSPSRSSPAHPIVEKLLTELAQVPAHAAQRLHELSLEAEKDNRLEEALTFADAHVLVAKKANATQSVILALLTRGKLLFKANQFSEAIPDLQDALRVSATDRSLPAAHRAHILYTACNLIGASLWRQGDRAAAATALDETTRLARSRFGEGSAEVIKSLFDQAHLAIEMRKPESEILALLDACVAEPGCKIERASYLLELGQALYMNCVWNAASYTLQVATQLSPDPLERSQALLSLGKIALFKSDIPCLHRFVDQAESLWMDVAPRPEVERQVAHLRALAALQEGCEETYRTQMFKAQQRGDFEEPTIEDRIHIQFVRAQVLRRAGLAREARQEIEEARQIAKRAIVSPLARCALFLQQAFCQQVEGNYSESNKLIDAAVAVARNELEGNSIIVARGLSLKAQNFYSLFTYSNPTATQRNRPLLDARVNAEEALRILHDQDVDHYTQKTLLRLLSGITTHLGLDAAQVEYNQRLARLEADYPDVRG